MSDNNARACAFKFFVCKRTPTIMDGPVFRWQLASMHRHPAPGEISVSRNGVLIDGTWPIILDEAFLGAFICVLGDAWSVYRKRRSIAIEGFEPPGWEGRVRT